MDKLFDKSCDLGVLNYLLVKIVERGKIVIFIDDSYKCNYCEYVDPCVYLCKNILIKEVDILQIIKFVYYYM